MNKDAMERIVKEAGGLTYAEWRRVCIAIEKAFASEQSRKKLDDPEAALRLLRLEL